MLHGYRPKAKVTGGEWRFLGFIAGIVYFGVTLFIILAGLISLFGWIVIPDVVFQEIVEGIFFGLIYMVWAVGMFWLWIKAIKPFFWG